MRTTGLVYQLLGNSINLDTRSLTWKHEYELGIITINLETLVLSSEFPEPYFMSPSELSCF